jgi:hypothetical protein
MREPNPTEPAITSVFYHRTIERNGSDMAGSYTLQIHLISTISLRQSYQVRLLAVLSTVIFSSN